MSRRMFRFRALLRLSSMLHDGLLSWIPCFRDVWSMTLIGIWRAGGARIVNSINWDSRSLHYFF